MSEFTGERVVPGLVDADLWAEHLARYAFAAPFARGRRVLDVGCGTGYGCAELAREAQLVAGVDVAADAIDYAREHSTQPNQRYAQASATALPFAAASFQLVTAFEVIEHLKDWRDLLAEARRVLDSSGVFLVSTPNRLYYAESRVLTGPNPFHVHEFEYQEFREALQEFFPHVQIVLQDHVGAFAFHGAGLDQSVDPGVDSRIDSDDELPDSAHFFIGVCGLQPLHSVHRFLYVPKAANVLREREHHIRLLQQELGQSKQWLDQIIADHQRLQTLHENLTEHLHKQNQWALALETELNSARARIIQLQDEAAQQTANANAVAAGYARKVAELEEESAQKTKWGEETETRLMADLAARAAHLAATAKLLDAAEAKVIERTQWGNSLNAQLGDLRAQLAMVRQSRWIKLGHKLGLGPNVNRG